MIASVFLTQHIRAQIRKVVQNPNFITGGDDAIVAL